MVFRRHAKIPTAQVGGFLVDSTISGVVKDGLIVPSVPLPEGAQVDIRLREEPLEVPPELQEELQAWQRGSANALEMVERLAQEMEANEKR
jgi:hypothetical protein